MKNILSYILIIFCFITYINAQDNRLLIQDLDLKAYISLDREEYRIGDDIYLNVEIINQSSEPVKFYTSPYKLNNIKIYILNLQQGDILEEKYSEIIKRNELKKDKPELFQFQEKTLYPDEVLKFRINLPEYFKFTDNGRYKIKIEFDPFANTTSAHKIHISNPLFLILKKRQSDETLDEIIQELKKFEEKKRYTPEGTIEFMLNSYKKGEWDGYFLYQDLDKLILQYDRFRDRYIKASKVMKKKIIDEFKTWLINRKNRKIDYFEILDVFHSYKDKKSVVKCKVKYKAPALYKTFIYNYQLKQQAHKWIVKNVDVLTYSKER